MTYMNKKPFRAIARMHKIPLPGITGIQMLANVQPTLYQRYNNARVFDFFISFSFRERSPVFLNVGHTC